MGLGNRASCFAPRAKDNRSLCIMLWISSATDKQAMDKRDYSLLATRGSVASQAKASRLSESKAPMLMVRTDSPAPGLAGDEAHFRLLDGPFQPAARLPDSHRP